MIVVCGLCLKEFKVSLIDLGLTNLYYHCNEPRHGCNFYEDACVIVWFLPLDWMRIKYEKQK